MANESISKILNLEGATFHVVRIGECPSCHSFLTRDYLDFLVEHQSSTTNNAPGDSDITEVIYKRIRKNAALIRHKAERIHERAGICEGKICDSRLRSTLAIMVFSTNSASASSRVDQMQRGIRKLFFETTFWSVYTHFPRIVIYVGSGSDREILRRMNLPIWGLFDLSGDLEAAERRGWDGKGVPPAPTKQHLPKYSLLHTTQNLKNNDSWGWAKYIYYTEGDLVLHLRAGSEIFDMIDGSQSNFLAVPHRMQTLPLVQNFPQRLQSRWPRNSPQNIQNVTLIKANASHDHALGSCCDHGRYQFADCGGWWYNCRDWGLKNHDTWIKFGKHGLTMPLSTEHQATCKYSSSKIQCPLPKDCKSRVPLWKSKTESPLDICQEFPIIRKVGGRESKEGKEIEQ